MDNVALKNELLRKKPAFPCRLRPRLLVVLTLLTIGLGFASVRHAGYAGLSHFFADKGCSSAATGAKHQNACTSRTEPFIVTAFIDIGNFQKGDHLRTVEQFSAWFKVWGKIRQPVVFYYNQESVRSRFSVHRRHLPTKYVLVNMFEDRRHWSSRLLQKTNAIFAQSGYPKYHPPTTNARYSVIMHGKYEFLADAIENNYFASPYAMWLDIGLFRDYRKEACFTLQIPPGFDESKIAFSKVGNLTMNVTAKKVVWNMPFWLCGCLLVGERRQMKRFIQQYRLVRDKMIQMNLTGDDQMTLYSMFSDPTLGVQLDVEIQPYEDRYNYTSDPWFYLGYAMKREVPC